MAAYSHLIEKLLGLLLPGKKQFSLTDIFVEKKSIWLHLKTTSHEAACVSCGALSSNVHSHYQRKLLDFPIFFLSLLLLVRVRRFFCKNSACDQKIFSESIDSLACRYSRMTKRLEKVITQVGLESGGEVGHRILGFFNVSLSADTILRKVAKTTLTIQQKVKVLGVDDWAWRKGKRYGTVLVDL